MIVHEVFDEAAGGLAPLYRTANKLHLSTRERVIRRELLFAPGDPFEPDLLAQTERNLRALGFLRDAQVRAVLVDQDGDGSRERVNVTVVAWDAWTTVPEINLARIGNRLIWTLGASENNIAGLGKQGGIARHKDFDRYGTTLFYRDRQLMGSRAALTLTAADQSDGSRGTFTLERPFFSLTDRWAWALRMAASDQRDPLFSDGREVIRLRHVARSADLELAHAVVRQPTRGLRLHLAYRLREDQVDSDVRDFGILEVGLSSAKQQFVKLSHVNRFERTEDFNLGAESSAIVGLSSPRLGGEPDPAWFFSLAHRQALWSGSKAFLVGYLWWTGRRQQGSLENAVVQGGLRSLWKQSNRFTLIGSGDYRHGTNLDPEVQLLLGAESGLRGYPVRRFSGTRSALFSAEQRWFAVDDLAQLVSIAFAAFADSGFVWPMGESISLSDLKTSVGLGLLVGHNRLSSTERPLRFDLAHAFNAPRDAAQWVFSAGSTLRF